MQHAACLSLSPDSLLLHACGSVGCLALTPLHWCWCTQASAALEIKAEGRCITAAEELMAPGLLDALGWGGALLSGELAELCR